jgi:hypothetical protein
MLGMLMSFIRNSYAQYGDFLKQELYSDKVVILLQKVL